MRKKDDYDIFVLLPENLYVPARWAELKLFQLFLNTGLSRSWTQLFSRPHSSMFVELKTSDRKKLWCYTHTHTHRCLYFCEVTEATFFTFAKEIHTFVLHGPHFPKRPHSQVWFSSPHKDRSTNTHSYTHDGIQYNVWPHPQHCLCIHMHVHTHTHTGCPTLPAAHCQTDQLNFLSLDSAPSSSPPSRRLPLLTSRPASLLELWRLFDFISLHWPDGWNSFVLLYEEDKGRGSNKEELWERTASSSVLSLHVSSLVSHRKLSLVCQLLQEGNKSIQRL